MYEYADVRSMLMTLCTLKADKKARKAASAQDLAMSHVNNNRAGTRMKAESARAESKAQSGAKAARDKQDLANDKNKKAEASSSVFFLTVLMLLFECARVRMYREHPPSTSPMSSAICFQATRAVFIMKEYTSTPGSIFIYL